MPYSDDIEIQGISCDYQEVMYLAGHGLSIRPVDSPTTLEYLGDFPPGMQCAGDITYRDGGFYMSTTNNELAYFTIDNPGSAAVVFPFPPGTPPIVGLITYPITCDSFITYAFSDDPVLRKVYEVDFENQTLIEFCDHDIEDLTGVGSRTECQPPPCELSVDLDADDSSGALLLDYTSPSICEAPTAISDGDVVMVSEYAEPDSVLVSLTNPLDGANEFLTWPGTNGNLQVLGLNSQLIRVENLGAATVTDFAQVISEIQYHNTAAAPSLGARIIELRAYTAGLYESLASTATINFGPDFIDLQAMLTDPACPGEENGAISLDPAGGTQPYTFNWEDGT
ncbi:MAG: SprB repeat-containing protein, partial [Bacteroidota bacterium]